MAEEGGAVTFRAVLCAISVPFQLGPGKDIPLSVYTGARPYSLVPVLSRMMRNSLTCRPARTKFLASQDAIHFAIVISDCDTHAPASARPRISAIQLAGAGSQPYGFTGSAAPGVADGCWAATFAAPARSNKGVNERERISAGTTDRVVDGTVAGGHIRLCQVELGTSKVEA